jgi:hypothetical protein
VVVVENRCLDGNFWLFCGFMLKTRIGFRKFSISNEVMSSCVRVVGFMLKTRIGFCKNFHQQWAFVFLRMCCFECEFDCEFSKHVVCNLWCVFRCFGSTLILCVLGFEFVFLHCCVCVPFLLGRWFLSEGHYFIVTCLLIFVRSAWMMILVVMFMIAALWPSCYRFSHGNSLSNFACG